MNFHLKKQALVLTAVLTLTSPVLAFAQENTETSDGTVVEQGLDGSRLKERWQEIYNNATPEQQAKMDQKKAEFQAMSPEEKKALVRDHRENRVDRAENRIDRKENRFDRREDVYDANHDGGVRDDVEDVYDRREDVRDHRENVRDRRENRIDRKFKGGELRGGGNR